MQSHRSRTVRTFPSTPLILVHACAAVQSAKGPTEVEYKSDGVVINKSVHSQLHSCCHHWETAEPITGNKWRGACSFVWMMKRGTAAGGRWWEFWLKLLSDDRNKQWMGCSYVVFFYLNEQSALQCCLSFTHSHLSCPEGADLSIGSISGFMLWFRDSLMQEEPRIKPPTLELMSNLLYLWAIGPEKIDTTFNICHLNMKLCLLLNFVFL